MKSKHINLMYLPVLFLFLFFVYLPFAEGIRLSFTNWNGYSKVFDYIGWDNYRYLFADDRFKTAFVLTFFYGIGSTLFQQIIGLGYALFLNQRFFGRSFARTIIYLPVLFAGVIMGFMYSFIFQYNNGALNDVMTLFGQIPLDWLGSGSRAVWIILLVNVIQFCGVSMVIYLAGLQNIPRMYYEAASLDGVSAWAQFKHITLPLLLPSISASVIINLIGGLKLFGPIRSLTNGGPGYATHSLSTYISYTYFSSQNAGYAAAIGIVLFLIIGLITVLTMKKSKKQKELCS